MYAYPVSRDRLPALYNTIELLEPETPLEIGSVFWSKLISLYQKERNKEKVESIKDVSTNIGLRRNKIRIPIFLMPLKIPVFDGIGGGNSGYFYRNDSSVQVSDLE